MRHTITKKRKVGIRTRRGRKKSTVSLIRVKSPKEFFCAALQRYSSKKILYKLAAYSQNTFLKEHL